MSTTRSLSHSYPAGPARLAALLREPDFLRRRCEEAGETNIRISVRDLEHGFSASVARDKVIEVPSFARRLVQPRNHITDVYEWHEAGSSWHATYTVVIANVPAQVRGKSALAAVDAGTRHETSFEVLVRIPLLGARLESFVADRLQQTFLDQVAFNSRSLEP